jgi:hypothetical protein
MNFKTIFDLIESAFRDYAAGKVKKRRDPDAQLKSLLLTEGRERRKSANRYGRSDTNITGGLFGNPTLGGTQGIFGL